jgi:hypothetical protein
MLQNIDYTNGRLNNGWKAERQQLNLVIGREPERWRELSHRDAKRAPL